jgi:hypothetical protein
MRYNDEIKFLGPKFRKHPEEPFVRTRLVVRQDLIQSFKTINQFLGVRPKQKRDLGVG